MRMLTKVLSPITRWSVSGIPIISPASAIFFVTAISSADGVGSPLGWLCRRMMEAAWRDKASIKISLG